MGRLDAGVFLIFCDPFYEGMDYLLNKYAGTRMIQFSFQGQSSSNIIWIVLH